MKLLLDPVYPHRHSDKIAQPRSQHSEGGRVLARETSLY